MLTLKAITMHAECMGRVDAASESDKHSTYGQRIAAPAVTAFVFAQTDAAEGAVCWVVAVNAVLSVRQQ